MIVVANGGYRTGSTFIFLAIQEILRYNGIEFEEKILSTEEIQNLDSSKNYVVKSHNWIPPIDTTIKTVYSRRNYLDVYASFIKANITVLDPITEILEEKRREKLMLGLRILVLEYQDFFNNEIFAVNKIAKYLKLSTPIIHQLNRKNVRNLNHPALMNNHISENPAPGNFIEILTYEEIKNLTQKYSEVFNG